MYAGFCRFLLSLALVVSTLTAWGADVPALNLRSRADADVFARAMVARYEAEARQQGISPAELDPLIIVHVGSSPPEQLQWIMLHLEAAKIPVELELITEDEMNTKLEDAKNQALLDQVYLTYDPERAEARKRSIKETWQNALLKTKQVFGLPNGFTAWIRTERSEKLKTIEAALGAANAALAGLSVGYTYYLTEHVQGAALHPLRAAMFVAAWTWWTTYQGRSLSELITQAKVIKENPSGVFKPTHSKLFTFVGNTIRSLLGNAIVVAGSMDIQYVFTDVNLEQNLWNTTVNIFARSWVDDWFARKMPDVKPDGTIVPDATKGQWGLKRWLLVNSAWNLVYSFGKSAQLLGIDPSGHVDYLYYGMGAVGVLKLIYDERYNIRNKFYRATSVFRDAEIHVCESMIISPGASAPH